MIKNIFVLILITVLISGCGITMNITYYPNGNVKEKISYQNGQKNGTNRVYDQDGVLVSETNYKDGRLHGVAKGFYNNGKIATKTPYRYNERHGVARIYDNTGTILRQTPYKDGKKYGVMKLYDNGKVYAKIAYNDDKAVNGICVNGRILTDDELENIDKLDLEIMCMKKKKNNIQKSPK